MRMFNPPHPGEILADFWLEPLNLTITQTAKNLNVTRKTVSALVNGKTGVSPEMALRLELVFGKSAESWLSTGRLRSMAIGGQAGQFGRP